MHTVCTSITAFVWWTNVWLHEESEWVLTWVAYLHNTTEVTSSTLFKFYLQSSSSWLRKSLPNWLDEYQMVDYVTLVYLVVCLVGIQSALPPNLFYIYVVLTRSNRHGNSGNSLERVQKWISPDEAHTEFAHQILAYFDQRFVNERNMFHKSGGREMTGILCSVT